MKTLRLIPLVVVLAACSSVSIPVSSYRIDVQQGNALEQEAVDKLKVGMTSAQVRFLLGTPLLVDPFRNNRWDYVYNYRKGGKLTEKKRLALFFEGEVLARIDAEGFSPKPVVPEQDKTLATKTEEKPAKTSVLPVAENNSAAASVNQAKPAALATEPAPVMAESVRAVEATLPVTTSVAAILAPPVAEKTTAPKVAAAIPAAVVAVPSEPAKAVAAERTLNETSIVPPMVSSTTPLPQASRRPTSVSEKPPEPMALQPETNVAAVVPDTVPAFPDGLDKAAGVEGQVMAALNAWVNAWKSRDEEGYLAAYAASFQPPGGLTRTEWEKRRRLLLGLSRNIDLKIDGQAFEAVAEDKAQVSFRQFYRSDAFQDAVIKQLKFVRVDNLWLIEEEKVLAPIKVKK